MTRITQNINNWHVFYILILITFFTSLSSGIINPDKADMAWWSGWLQNFSTEMMGAIATFLLFEGIIEARKRREDKKDALEKEKEDLILDIRSSDNATALNVLSKVRANSLFNDSLSGANLTGADLTGAVLVGADLAGADLAGADLTEAVLTEANLSHANLKEAKLTGAKLTGANLIGADLQWANLSKADLNGAILSNVNLIGAILSNVNLNGAKLNEANLAGADLTKANLTKANLREVVCDEKTILPDGTNWTPDTDWTKYTGTLIT